MSSLSPLAHLTAEQWPAVSALLDEALALDPAARDTFVQQLDGERAQYRDTLRALLAQAAGVETDQFLATLPRVTGVLDRNSDVLTELAADQTIGPYRLLRELGTGGMGAVWLAERADGRLKRQVALKLPRLAWGRGLAERMARERDILASLEHPHIARLYDAGVDQHGRPYLALEYVEGQPIDVYARDRALSVRRKLDLLLQVCAAVAFAHSRLVVHRDLKPGNILVTADGQVRLLDFGIAKLMEGERTQETQLTQMAGRALTLDYASPEQIQGEPIGTASDVYSLGVVAYELLTGARPYKLKRGSAAELEEAIAGVDPVKASEAAAETQSKRALRGDLDAILNKALKKAPVERYPTIDALAQDFTRHINSEPVSAQPDAFGYRAAKFAGRNRLQVAAAAFATAALGLGVGVALWQAQEAQRQRDRAVDAAAAAQRNAARADGEAMRAREQERAADQQRAEAARAAEAARVAADEASRQARAARAEQQRAEQVKRFVLAIFQDADGALSPMPTTDARTLLLRAGRRLDQRPIGNAAVDVELRHAIAYSLNGLHDPAAALEQLHGLRQRAAEALGREHPLPVLIALNEAEALAALGRRAESEAIVDEAVAVARSARLDGPLVIGLSKQSAVQYLRNAPARGVAQAREAVTVAERMGGEDATLMRFRAYSALSRALSLADDRSEVLTAAERALRYARLTYPGEPNGEVLFAMATRATALADAGRARESIDAFRDVLAGQRRLGRNRVLATSLITLGHQQVIVGQLDEAAASYAEATTIYAGLGDAVPNERAIARMSTTSALLALRDVDRALPAADAAVADARTVFGAEHPYALNAELMRASALVISARWDEAQAAFDATRDRALALPAAAPAWLARLSHLRLAQGRWAVGPRPRRRRAMRSAAWAMCPRRDAPWRCRCWAPPNCARAGPRRPSHRCASRTGSSPRCSRPRRRIAWTCGSHWPRRWRSPARRPRQTSSWRRPRLTGRPGPAIWR